MRKKERRMLNRATSRGRLTLPHTEESHIPFSREVRYIVDLGDSDHKKSRYGKERKEIEEKIKND